MKYNWLLYLILILGVPLNAKVRLPSIIGDNMVLQRNAIVNLWGWSDSRNEVVIQTSWQESSISTKVDDWGEWQIQIKTPEAGGPFVIVFDDGEKLVIKNVYVGEVWLCSGQSNMEMPVKGFYGQPVIKSLSVTAEAHSDIPIRMFTVEKKASVSLEKDVSGLWHIHTSESVSEFSATAYFFGKQLYNSLKVPIGLINASWSASNIQAWMSPEVLKMYKDVSLVHLTLGQEVRYPHQTASMLYNSMLYPLRHFNVRGMIWYQGEANRFNPIQYKRLLPDFVKQMRDLFNNEKMPFYYVQIAPFGYRDKSDTLSGVLLREAQYECEEMIPYSGMVVLTDLGEEKCIHPANKDIVGQRLAYLALQFSYNKKGLYAQSPRYYSKKIVDNKIVLTFKNCEMGLTSFGKDLLCFEVCGIDNVFYKAKAFIKGNSVVVWSDNVSSPIECRYAFSNYVQGDLFGINGLPISSFRTNK